MEKALSIILKVLYGVLTAALLFVIATEFSPIYNFRKPQPFTGLDIFNPYRNLDTAYMWKRSVFHVHTRVKGPWPVDESQAWPQEVYDAYKKFGYDIVTFSNHNELTKHPFDSSLQVNVYEQGYSPYKFHKLVFGSKRVRHWDPLFPFLASQKQFELDRLGKDSDFIQINHPYRTWGMDRHNMESLSGYEIIELDSGKGTENTYWDYALSAGHYSFGLATDDLHDPYTSCRIARRCNFVCCPSPKYEDIKAALLGGAYYSMRIPDYGKGDWDQKYERNRELPEVTGIGLKGDTLYIELSAKADSIRVTGQGHRTLALGTESAQMEYKMLPEDNYARFTAFFPGGEVIYSNPFARYDSSINDSPFNNAPQKINVLLTILFNGLLAALAAALIWLFCAVVKKR